VIDLLNLIRIPPHPNRSKPYTEALNNRTTLMFIVWSGFLEKKPLWCGGRGESEINHRGLNAFLDTFII
jgi:hypothetical protein